MKDGVDDLEFTVKKKKGLLTAMLPDCAVCYLVHMDVEEVVSMVYGFNESLELSNSSAVHHQDKRHPDRVLHFSYAEVFLTCSLDWLWKPWSKRERLLEKFMLPNNTPSNESYLDGGRTEGTRVALASQLDAGTRCWRSPVCIAATRRGVEPTEHLCLWCRI